MHGISRLEVVDMLDAAGGGGFGGCDLPGGFADVFFDRWRFFESQFFEGFDTTGRGGFGGSDNWKSSCSEDVNNVVVLEFGTAWFARAVVAWVDDGVFGGRRHGGCCMIRRGKEMDCKRGIVI